MPFSIAIVGTGNVGYHYAKRLKAISNSPKAILSRSSENAQHLISELNLGAEIITTNQIIPDVDFVILAVPDNALTEILDSYSFDQKSIIVHTSGAQSIGLLKKYPQHGVLYPLQTFTKTKEVNFDQIPFLIEANDENTLLKIRELARLLGSNIQEVDSEKRLRIHLAAVFACNFSNHLYNAAEQILAGTNVQLKDLRHLIQETMDKAIALGAEQSQTGPAIRGDIKVIEKHLELLNGEKDLRDIYELITDQISTRRKT